MSRPGAAGGRWRPWLLRLIGVGLLAWLLARLDLAQAARVLVQASLAPLLLAAVLLLPLIGLKTIRWLGYLRVGPTWQAFHHGLRVYFGGLFVGFITPGRLGEFARAYFVRDYVGGSVPRALLTVLVDRLFDLAALLAVGALALLSSPVDIPYLEGLGWLLMIAAAILPLLVELSARGRLAALHGATGRGRLGKLTERSLSALAGLPKGRWLPALLLTLAAYLVFYGQGYLLSRSLRLGLGFMTVAQCLALASLAALLPISISGLGTREWVVTLYLGAHGLQPERALAFSGLVFLMFNLVGGLLGGLAWISLPDRPRLGDREWAASEGGTPRCEDDG